MPPRRRRSTRTPRRTAGNLLFSMRENSYLKIIYLTNLPVIIQAVDREEKIRDIIPELKRILPGKLIIIEDIEIVSGERFTETS